MSLLAEKWKGYVKLSSLMGPLLTGTKYCKQMNLNDHDALATGTKENFMIFFKWLCDTSKIQKKTKLLGYKRAFKMMYEKSVGMALNTEIYEALHLWIDHDLSKLYNLDLERREKPVLCFDDVFRLLQTHWGSPDIKYPSERQRLNVALMQQIFTTTRPATLAQKCYG
ncbi:hypothetical protein QBC36DRAFT_200731 [Triangularia setosa]|uniref:Uncharacterized protein n=1 Tax=Triangularia setosa TaxID=2587417 RepID=A0AAN6VVW5_9PEZI|nr:hypothetical protein QBC36DRAFT_200731 [Podospora setosa]